MKCAHYQLKKTGFTHFANLKKIRDSSLKVLENALDGSEHFTDNSVLAQETRCSQARLSILII
jgi:hypothetical protein